MTCKDCVHYIVCKDDCDSGYLYEDENGNYFTGGCNGFINKADFVEVVRCKDCRHCEDYDEQDEYGWYHCAMHDMPTKLENFCSFGEGSDTNG